MLLSSIASRRGSTLGVLAHRFFFHQAAIEYYDRSVSVARVRGENENVSQALNSLGSLYAEEEDWDRSCQFFVLALQSLDNIGKSPLARHILENLGHVYRMQGEYHQAIQCYSRILKETDAKDRLSRADALSRLGDLCKMAGDMVNAEECFKKSLSERERCNDFGGVLPRICPLWGPSISSLARRRERRAAMKRPGIIWKI